QFEYSSKRRAWMTRRAPRVSTQLTTTVAVQTSMSAARVVLVVEWVRVPVERIELVQAIHRHQRFEAPNVRPAVELPADVGLAHSVGIERLDVQAAGGAPT